MAVRIAMAAWVDETGLRVAAAGDAQVSWALREVGSSVTVVHVEVDRPDEVEIAFSLPLGDAIGFWHPRCGPHRTLTPDWAGEMDVSMVSGAVVGCLFDSAGHSMLAFASAETVAETHVRYGVSEEDKTFVVAIRAALAPGRAYQLALTRADGSVAAVLRCLREWLRGAVPQPPLPTPEGARVPVYSTWYAFHQRMRADTVEREAAAAAELGCGALILDDGWQMRASGHTYEGCGGWRPDPAKFPDLAGHVRRVREFGLRYLLWVAPLLLGEESEVFPALSRYAPARAGGAPRAFVLDPRIPQVRDHVVALCRRLVTEHGADGLKLDFLDEAMVYSGRRDTGVDADVADVGEAMRALLTSVRDELAQASPGGDVLVELRQPYIGPGMHAFGTMLRAGDCPGDAVANRTGVIDIGLLALGGAVHSDMILWDPAASAQVVARHLIAALHSVPQISVRPTELTADQTAALAFWLRTWRELRPLLLDGVIEPGRPDEQFPVVTATRDAASSITVFADRVVPVDLAASRTITLINATGAPRLILDVTGPESTVECVIHDAAGRRTEHKALRLSPGVTPLEVPPYGLARLARHP